MSEYDSYEQVQAEMREGIQRSIDVGVAMAVKNGCPKDLAEKLCTMIVIGQVNDMGRANFNGPASTPDTGAK